MNRGWVWVCTSTLALGCGAELPAPLEQASIDVQFEPESDASRVPPALRIDLKSSLATPSSLKLFQGALSDYYLSRLRSGDLPNTLLEREVPILAWSTSTGVRVAPPEFLPDGVYTLTSSSLGVVSEFTVATDPGMARLERFWPREAGDASYGAYCGERVPAANLDLLLEPAGIKAALLPGLTPEGAFSEQCLHIEAETPLSPGAIALPPTFLEGGFLIDPSPFFGETQTEIANSCHSNQVSLGGGCAEVLDDRLLLSGQASLLWLFESPARLALISGAGDFVEAKGLSPASTVHLAGRTLDEVGRGQDFECDVSTLAPRARLVLNEVLPNAVGPEPGEEWVELFNDGTKPIDLKGYQLADAGGAVELPELALGPGAFALLAKEGYSGGASGDVPPAPGTSILLLPSLGKNGLSNDGEKLELVDPNGAIVSSFPALRAKSPGVSLARKSSAAPDDDSGSFGEHASPGASPGAPNLLASDE